MSYVELPHIRRASREMVRRLGLVQGTCNNLPLSLCHALIELDGLGSATVGQLAELLCLDKSSACRIVAGLEKKGWVARISTTRDKRRKPVALTGAGRVALGQIHAVSDKPVETALELLRPQERARVLEGLELYARALKRAQAQEGVSIREIRREDNPAVAALVRAVLTEYGGNRPGTTLADPNLDTLYEAFQSPKQTMFVVEQEGRIYGTGGIATLPGESDVCELQKMYFQPELRGLGIGSRLMTRCLDFAREAGYRGCYLETMTTMERAQRLYQSYGFKRVEHPLGQTGHCGCDRWYYLDFE